MFITEQKNNYLKLKASLFYLSQFSLRDSYLREVKSPALGEETTPMPQNMPGDNWLETSFAENDIVVLEAEHELPVCPYGNQGILGCVRRFASR